MHAENLGRGAAASVQFDSAIKMLIKEGKSPDTYLVIHCL